LNNHYQYHKFLQSKNVILAYKGSVSNDLLDTILSLVDNKMTHIEPQSKLRRKVYTIIVEVLQNIYHHFDTHIVSVNHAEDLDSILFVLSKVDDGYDIIAGNYVAQKDVPLLQNRLEDVNKMSAEQIKNTYRTALNNGEFSAKGGAGLGILDIARRSGKQLEYEFETTPKPDFSFFSLKVKVPAISD